MEKPNVFESVWPCSGQYSFKRDLRLNAWLAVTMLVYLGQLYVLRENAGWTPLGRSAVALLPLIPFLLYIRSWVRFVRGLDELQRRVQGEAYMFAAWGTLIVGIILATLNQEGAINLAPHGLGLGGVLFLVWPLWLVGVAIANCRYK